jgi:hypothetical protein
MPAKRAFTLSRLITNSPIYRIIRFSDAEKVGVL